MKFSDLEPVDRPEIVDLFVSVSRPRLQDDESAVLVIDAKEWEEHQRVVGFYCAGVHIPKSETSIIQDFNRDQHPLEIGVFVRIRGPLMGVSDGPNVGASVIYDDQSVEALVNVEWLDKQALDEMDDC